MSITMGRKRNNQIKHCHKLVSKYESSMYANDVIYMDDADSDEMLSLFMDLPESDKKLEQLIIQVPDGFVVSKHLKVGIKAGAGLDPNFTFVIVDSRDNRCWVRWNFNVAINTALFQGAKQ